MKDFVDLVKDKNMFAYLLARMDKVNNAFEKGNVLRSAQRELYCNHITDSQYNEICNIYDYFVDSHSGVSRLAVFDTMNALEEI